ncbi:MAG TPA: glycosyltransferase family 87 protein [Candidatus Limnocylindrales bacterium]|nr:glycosyltransferase family 87 protein [Candidatus Limnocylindrales bacterium]
MSGLIFGAYIFVVSAPRVGSLAFDAVAYWRMDLSAPYSGTYGQLGFFPYSPAIALLISPLTWLPWQAFIALWYAVLIAAVLWLGRSRFVTLLAFPPVAIELYHANIHLLLAVAIVVGFRYPAAWAFLLLTKVTPGVGLLWFAARKEWSKLGVALGATTLAVGGTFVLFPAQWIDWITLLGSLSGQTVGQTELPVPLWVRLPPAIALVWWGARTDRYWTVPAAATLSLPVLWPGGFAVLAACWLLPGPDVGYDLRHALDRMLNRVSARFHRPAGI